MLMILNVIKTLRIRRISVKISTYFIVLFVCVLLIINVCTSVFFEMELVKQANNLATVNTIVRDIHNNIKDIRESCIKLKNDPEVIKTLNMLSKDETLMNTAGLEKQKLIISNLFNPEMEDNPLVDKAVLMDANKIPLIITGMEKQTESSDFQNDLIEEFFGKAYLEEFKFDSSLNQIYYISKILDSNYYLQGAILVVINKDKLFEYTQIYCDEIFENAYVIDANNNVLFHLGSADLIEQVVSADVIQNRWGQGERIKVQNQNYLLCQKAISANTDWKLMGLISYQQLTKDVKLISTFLYIIGVICILGVSLVSFYIAKVITEPIVQVNRALAKVEEGEWPEPIKIQTDDELKSLVTGVNHTIESLQRMIQNIYKEEEEKKRVEVKLVHSQLELLQSQINPHFIYNTLNTFAFFALKNGDMKLRGLIQSFSKLLHFSISIENDFITIKDEMDLTERYLEIQKGRYGDIFRMTSEIDDRLLNYKIPKLILQPLVENALYHGIVPKGINGTIKLSFLGQPDGILICVQDDGIGIENDRIKDLLEGRMRQKTKGFSNIGISNINERLKLYFGETYALQIYSQEQERTIVSFKIPYIK